MKTKLRNIRLGIVALIYWLPIIWKWRSWDYSYTLRVLAHSLKGQRAAIANKTEWQHLHWERDVKNMSICIEAIERLTSDRDTLIHLEFVPDPKGLMGMRVQLTKDAPMGTKKARYAWEDDRRKMYLRLFTEQLRKHLLGWWD